MPIGDDVRSKDVIVEVSKPVSSKIALPNMTSTEITNILTLGVKDAPPAISAEELWEPVLSTDVYWEIDDVGDSGRCVVLELPKRLSEDAWEHLLRSDYRPPDVTITERTYMDFSIDGEPAGRVEYGLYGNYVPRTAQNFKQLCTGEAGEGASGKPLFYKGCKIHRIIPDFMFQGGDFDNEDGTGGESIFGRTFEDEKFGVSHDKKGLLSMANSGPDSNGSQFFITVDKAPWLDGTHVVFGEVTAGMDVADRVAKFGGDEGKPTAEVRITDCGVVGGDA
jgi:cyclophilin family peptidyl-prolyl cis-trans isomerase